MANPNADRNLLFGILALQLDFIGRDDLVAAMNAWVLEKSKPLGEILREQGKLVPDRLQLLDALVAEHLKQHGGDPEKSLASVSSIRSVREELRSLADPDVQASLAHVSLARKEQDPYATLPSTLGESTSAGTRFRILRPHAKGGLGLVSVALDEELHREVALKELQDHHADDPHSRSRFTLEAEITGGLEHPGIVPVYGLGQYADGRPFYAMRFIRGDSLKDAIERFHLNRLTASRRRPRSEPTPATVIPGSAQDRGGITPSKDAVVCGVGLNEGERMLEFRKLLGRFIDVCNAIEYAHSRGVLHRDLKPGNIMLGKYGETLVVDWGLAKPLGRSDETAKASDEATLRPSSGSGVAPTQMGSAIGTPAYMSPEQAAGRLEELGPRSDVYSLGATLYSLLTGQAPFSDTDLGTTLRKVQRGEFPAPREIKRDVPAPLEAICLKAMAIKSPDRYATPDELAFDVEHRLADEPVTVYHTRWPERLALWVRREPVVAALSAAVAITLLVGTVVSAWQAARAKAAEKQAVAEKGRADVKTAEALAEKTRADVKADEALANAKKALIEKDRADARAQEVRRNLYVTHMNLIQRYWEAGQVALVLDVLNQHGPRPGEEDLRGFEWYYQWRLCHQELRTLEGHTGSVHSVAFSHDGSRLASVSSTLNEVRFLRGSELLAQPEIKIWDTATGQQVRSLGAHNSVDRIAFSPDGKGLASAASDGTIKQWHATTGDELRTLNAHTNGVSGLAFSPDGKRLASAGLDGTVKLWDAATGQQATTLEANAGSLSTVVFSPDGSRLASASLGEIQIWDARTGQGLLTLKHIGRDPNLLEPLFGTTGLVVAFSPDGAQLASGGGDRNVVVWDAGTGRELRTLTGHTDAVRAVAFSPDGTQLASASEDQTIKLWDTATGQELRTLLGHTGWVNSLAFSSNGRHIASASEDRTIKLWDATEGQELHRLRADAKQVGLSDTLVPLPSLPFAQDKQVRSVEFSPDGARLASAGGDETVVLWDAATGRELRRLIGHTSKVESVAFSPDGGRIASASFDNTIKLWDVQTGHELRTLEGHTYSVFSLSFSPDGTRLASGSRVARREGNTTQVLPEGEIKVWDAATGNEQRTLNGHGSQVNSVRFNPDGTRIASASDDGTILVWDAATGQKLLTLKAGSCVHGFAFSLDGARLASGGCKETITLWDAAAGQELRTLRGHRGPIWSVAFSPDGARVASASGDRTIKLWDTATGQEVRTLTGATDAVRTVAFSSDGRRLASGSEDGTIHLWDARPWTPELRAEQEALSLVRFYSTPPISKDELLARIRADATVSEPVRERALEFAREWRKE